MARTQTFSVVGAMSIYKRPAMTIAATIFGHIFAASAKFSRRTLPGEAHA